jgi:hypothetical protein
MCKGVLVGMSFAVLAGCTTQMDIQIQQPVSADLKAQILKGAKDVLFDPYSVRDAEISGFIPRKPGSSDGFVCVKANAKNRMGAYVGRTGTLVFVNAGKVTDAMDRHPFCNNTAIRYRQFPELEAL